MPNTTVRAAATGLPASRGLSPNFGESTTSLSFEGSRGLPLRLQEMPAVRLRKRMAAAVDRLIAAIDALDADLTDLEEEEGDELDRGEEEHDGSEPCQDGEPSLGWTDHVNQELAASLNPEESGCCANTDEHSLGAPENHHEQQAWSQGQGQDIPSPALDRSGLRVRPATAGHQAACELARIRPGLLRRPAALQDVRIVGEAR